MQRTEQGKSLRKAYESHEIKHGFNEFREPVVRTDGMTNTISTVQKDNLLVESNRGGGRRSSQLTSLLTSQEPLIEPTVSRQDMMQESQISSKMIPVLLSKQATKFERIIEICGTLMARDWKSFGNQPMAAIIVSNKK